MRKILFILLIGFLSSCSTKELEANLVNVDTWSYVDNKVISGTTVSVKEISEISFRNKTFRNISISSGDTIFESNYLFTWECRFPNIIRYHLDGEDYYNEFELVEYSAFELEILGLLPRMKISTFKPKTVRY